MGWFDDIVSGVGNFLGNVTGNTEMNRAGAAQQGAMSGLQTAQQNAQGVVQNAGNLQNQFGQYGAGQQALGNQAQAGTMQSMGANAADYQQKALASAQKQATQQAQTAAGQGAANAASAARASGVNAGQAGLGAGQNASNLYTQTYVPAVTAGINQYQQGTGQMMNQGQMAQQNALAAQQQQLGAGGLALGGGQLQAGASGTMGQMGMQQQQSGQQQMNTLLSGIGSFLNLAEGGDVSAPKKGSAFPLLVESGERVQTEPYHGPDVSRIWGEAKNTLLGISGADYLQKRAAKKFGGEGGTTRYEYKTTPKGSPPSSGTVPTEEATEQIRRYREKYGYQEPSSPISEEQSRRRKMNLEYSDVEGASEGGDMLVSPQQEQQEEETPKPKEDILGDISKILSIGATIGMVAGLKSGGTVNYGPEGGATVSANSVQPLKAEYGVDVMNMGGGTNYVSGGSYMGSSSSKDDSDKPKPLIDVGGSIKDALKNLVGGGGGATPAAGSAASSAAALGPAAMLQKGADFIVPPGYDNDTYPLTVQPGTHVKVTPKKEVRASYALDMLKRKQLFNKMQSSKQTTEKQIEKEPEFPADFTSLMNNILRKE